MRDNRRTLIAGAVLIILGIVFLAQEINPDAFGDWLVPLGLGLVFLVAYVVRRQYGFLIAGCILASIGISLGLTETRILTGPGQDGVIVFALGLGFLAILLIDLLVRGRQASWWPIIPGAILAVIGGSILYGNEAWLQEAEKWWPLIFIAIGLLILLERLFKRPS